MRRAGKTRERFAGGQQKTEKRVYGSLKAVDPATGEIRAAQKLDYPNMAGALATAGNLVFLGHYDGTFAACDAKTLKEIWSFNVGSPIQALRSPIRSMANSTLPFSWERECGHLSSRTHQSFRTFRPGQEATYAEQPSQSHDHRAEGKSWRDAELKRLRNLHVDITQN